MAGVPDTAGRSGCPGGQGCQCKAPFPGTRGCLSASTNSRRIGAWWDRWPDANVAVATGAPGPDVLDVDVKPDGDGWAALARLTRSGCSTAPAPWSHPSGGLHVYYAGSGQRNGKLARHHLDFRGAGGYVLAPPSRVHGRPMSCRITGAKPPGGSTGRRSPGCWARPRRPPGRAPGRAVISAASPRGWPRSPKEPQRRAVLGRRQGCRDRAS